MKARVARVVDSLVKVKSEILEEQKEALRIKIAQEEPSVEEGGEEAAPEDHTAKDVTEDRTSVNVTPLPADDKSVSEKHSISKISRMTNRMVARTFGEVKSKS